MSSFLSGAVAFASMTCALFFLKFWFHVRDRLLAFFAASFFVFGIHWSAVALANPGADVRHYFSVMRLIAFGLIIVAIIDKNRKART